MIVDDWTVLQFDRKPPPLAGNPLWRALIEGARRPVSYENRNHQG
jgi:hypothetical protein